MNPIVMLSLNVLAMYFVFWTIKPINFAKTSRLFKDYFGDCFRVFGGEFLYFYYELDPCPTSDGIWKVAQKRLATVV